MTEASGQKLADRSEHGWSTIDEYVEDKLADDSDNEVYAHTISTTILRDTCIPLLHENIVNLECCCCPL